MTSLLQDIQFAARSFRRSPVFTAVAVLSLALGIGANTAIFTLVDQLILRLLPVQDPERIVLLAGNGRHYGGNNGRNAISYLMYQDLRDRNQVFSGMMCRYRFPERSSASGRRPRRSSANWCRAIIFRCSACVPRSAGSSPPPTICTTAQHPFIVLSYGWWQSRFAGDPQIVGQTIRVNNYPLTVVGVAQAGFEGMEPGLPAQMFVPMAMARAVRPGFTDMYDRRQRWVNVYGRLKPGVSIEQAQAGLQPLFHQIIEGEVTHAGLPQRHLLR